jgi:hypothetical protein
VPAALLPDGLGDRLGIQDFFGGVSHDLIVKAVEPNTDAPWVVLYVKRWLTAPVQHPEVPADRYGLSYRDVEELLAERGVEVDT